MNGDLSIWDLTQAGEKKKQQKFLLSQQLPTVDSESVTSMHTKIIKKGMIINKGKKPKVA